MSIINERTKHDNEHQIPTFSDTIKKAQKQEGGEMVVKIMGWSTIITGIALAVAWIGTLLGSRMGGLG